MLQGKSVVYCAVCKGLLHCNIKVNKIGVVQSIGFMTMEYCPKFTETCTFMTKIMMNKSIPEINKFFLSNKKISSCKLPIWEGVKYAILNLKS